MTTINCPGCQRTFPLQRSFPVHLSRSACCRLAFQRQQQASTNSQQAATNLSFELFDNNDEASYNSSGLPDHSMQQYDPSPSQSLEVHHDESSGELYCSNQPQLDSNFVEDQDEADYLNVSGASLFPPDSLYEEDEDPPPSNNAQTMILGPSPAPAETGCETVECLLFN